MINKKPADKYKKQISLIAKYLKELRYNETLTQSEVADEAGLHRNTISNIETLNNFTLLTLLRICDFYQISPSELLSIID